MSFRAGRTWLGFGFACTLGAADTGCARMAARAAEVSYLSAQLKCVDDAHTLEASRECRRAADVRWGVAPRANNVHRVPFSAGENP